MLCSNCSSSLPESAKFCPQCGTRIDPPDSEKQSSTIAETLEKPRNAYGLIVLTSVLALIIVFLIMDSNQRKDEVKEKTSSVPAEDTAEIKALREHLTANPDDLQSNIRMGNLMFDAGDFSGAIPFYTHAMHLDSLNIAIRIDLAVCYYNIQNTTVAIENMKKALELDPNHIKGLFNIGIMYAHLGDKQQARFYWEKLIGIEPSSNEGLRAMQMLESLKE